MWTLPLGYWATTASQTSFLNDFTDKWEVEVGDGVGGVARIVAEVVVGVTVGSTPGNREGLTHQTAPQSHILPRHRKARMVIHWELWPTVTMVSYPFIFNDRLKLNYNWLCVCMFAIQILTEKIQRLSPSLKFWLCPPSRWAQLWALCWPTTAPPVTVTVAMSLKVNVHRQTSTKAPTPNHQDPSAFQPCWWLWNARLSLLIILRPRSSVSAISIQRTKDLLQENQAVLHSVPATNQDMSRSTSTVPFSETADTPKFYQQNSLPNTPQNRRGGRGGRGRGRRGGRGEHQHAQPRRPTLLEMVKTPISSMHFTLYELSLLR